jgi:alpha-L-arabinofuranosidase
VIDDPFKFQGGSVPTLAAHKKILDLAKERGREVWFDIHIWTEAPPQPGNLAAERSFIEQLGKISPGAKYKVAIFEFNANNHALRRALANACAIEQVEQIGEKLSVTCSANGLQPDGQNDNGWDQGLLFLNPSQVWLQPPGWVTRMISQNYQPLLVESSVHERGQNLKVSAQRSQDGKTLVLQIVNISDQPIPAAIHLGGFTPANPTARIEQLAGSLDAVNTAQEPDLIKPVVIPWRHGFEQGDAHYSFPAHSFTVIRIE